jgi:hypothetical protein
LTATVSGEPVVEQADVGAAVKEGATGGEGVLTPTTKILPRDETTEEKEDELIRREDRDEESEEEEEKKEKEEEKEEEGDEEKENANNKKDATENIGKVETLDNFKFKSTRKDDVDKKTLTPAPAAPANVVAVTHNITEDDLASGATGSEDDSAVGGATGATGAIGSKCPNACSGNGDCNEMTGECSCHTTFQGPDCSLKSCGSCIHGNCAGETCVCDLDHFGESCELRKCPGDCSGHGECLSVSDDAASAACDCADGWSGLDCASPDDSADASDSSDQSGSGSGRNGSKTGPDIDICNHRCADSCAEKSMGDTMLYVDCFRRCSEKCTGVELIKKEFRSREAPETPLKVEPVSLPPSTPSASTQPQAPRPDNEDDALPTNDAISEGQRVTLGDTPPADKHDRLTTDSMKAAIETTFSAVRGSQKEDPLVRCQRCQRTLLAEAGVAGEKNLGVFLKGVCTKFTNGKQVDECEAVRVKYRANMVHDAPNLESALGEFCTSFFDVPCE